MLKYVYGPVPSRRLGQSLGIDPVPLKTCNLNCVYCQLGRTRPLTNKRSAFFPPEDIISQVKEALKAHKPGEIDWITFVGSWGDHAQCQRWLVDLRGQNAVTYSCSCNY